MTNLVDVPGIENTTDAFRKKVIKIADRLLIDPNFLMAIMSFESGGTFSPSIKSFAGSGATGLIQFMPKTAIGLGTTTTRLAKMSAVEQLDFVEKYFKPRKGKLKTIEDAYMAVLYPKGIGKGIDYVLFRKGTKAYSQNKGLDRNGNGEITVGEAAYKVRQRLGTDYVHNVVELKRGDKGPRVEMLQDELIDLGYLTSEQKKTGAGIFGPQTEKSLKAFQQDMFLSALGFLDLPTQVAIRQINDGVKKGSKGGIVRVLQERLVSEGFLTKKDMKTGPGIFGPKTQNALIGYQMKNELEPDGVLTDLTFRLLFKRAVKSSVKPNGKNKEVDVVIPASGKGFTVYNADGTDQFGTQLTINSIRSLAEDWFLLHPEVPIQIGDISRRWGGEFRSNHNKSKWVHRSHRNGQDVDIRPIRKDNRLAPVTVGSSKYDSYRTEEFIRLLLSKYPTAKIFFNDRRLVNKGLTKHVNGHHNHIHVRFP